jgi:hypothetical protein
MFPPNFGCGWKSTIAVARFGEPSARIRLIENKKGKSNREGEKEVPEV